MSTQTLHFEQFMQEAWSMYPQAQSICGTEEPLTLQVNGQPVDPAPLLAAHHPVWLAPDRTRIQADGVDSAAVAITCPHLAGQAISLFIQQGTSRVEQQVPLDAAGRGSLEISSPTVGTLLVGAVDFQVKTILTAVPLSAAGTEFGSTPS
jgi:hypothetical protein